MNVKKSNKQIASGLLRIPHKARDDGYIVTARHASIGNTIPVFYINKNHNNLTPNQSRTWNSDNVGKPTFDYLA